MYCGTRSNSFSLSLSLFIWVDIEENGRERNLQAGQSKTTFLKKNRHGRNSERDQPVEWGR